MTEAPPFPPFTRFTWDETKRWANIAERGIDFALSEHFEFRTAVTAIDDRADYGEVREVVIGFIDTRLHVLVFTRREPALHVISLRKANSRERKKYDQATQKT